MQISKSPHKELLVLLLIPLFISQSCAGTVQATPTMTFPTVTQTVSPRPTGQFDLSQMNVDEWSSTSPDGRWVSAGLVAFPKENIGGQLAYVRLMIFSVDGNAHWTIIDKWQDINLGFPVPAPLKWSRDGKHFYFTYRVIPDGCSAFAFLTDLQQVNLGNGTTDDLLRDSALALALSPDDSQVAYFFGGDRGLVLRDLITGEERETEIDPGKDFNAGNILWSPDGKSLALTLAINPCTGAFGVSKTVWAESTTILWVDAKTFQQKALIDEDPRLFITWEWPEPEKITITDGQQNSIWYLDVHTGEITRP